MIRHFGGMMKNYYPPDLEDEKNKLKSDGLLFAVINGKIFSQEFLLLCCLHQEEESS